MAGRFQLDTDKRSRQAANYYFGALGGFFVTRRAGRVIIMNARELRAERAELLKEADSASDRRFELIMERVKDLNYLIEQKENGGVLRSYGSSPGYFGDNERALIHYVRTGDRSGLRDTHQAADGDFDIEIRMPNLERRATDQIMNVAAAADGGAAVPTGFARMIAARRSEIELASKLGCRRVVGQGTTVNYPYENADPAQFALTAEQVDNYSNTYERDRPTLDTKAFTLVKYTKKIALTEELEQDEDANLLEFIADHIGRAIAATNNYLLLTEVAANGTSLKTFASATVIAVDELEPIVYNDTLAYYLDDTGSVAWVMKPSVYGELTLLDDANTRRYASMTMGPRSLLEYPVFYSNQSGATAASTKSVYFGNWSYVGWRVDPALKLIRDPYTTDGITYLKYSFRAVFGVLIAGAIGFGVHPSA